MGFSGEKNLSSGADDDRVASADTRKSAERQRLAEALRANLRRRKDQSRERRLRDPSDASESGAATQKD